GQVSGVCCAVAGDELRIKQRDPRIARPENAHRVLEVASGNAVEVDATIDVVHRVISANYSGRIPALQPDDRSERPASDGVIRQLAAAQIRFALPEGKIVRSTEVDYVANVE